MIAAEQRRAEGEGAPAAEQQPARPALRVRIARRMTPPIVDTALAFGGLLLAAAGAGLIHAPAGLIVGGVGLFYLGAWHR